MENGYRGSLLINERGKEKVIYERTLLPRWGKTAIPNLVSPCVQLVGMLSFVEVESCPKCFVMLPEDTMNSWRWHIFTRSVGVRHFSSDANLKFRPVNNSELCSLQVYAVANQPVASRQQRTVFSCAAWVLFLFLS